MKVSKIKARDKFSHGKLNMNVGDTDKIEADEAEELRKAGLVDIVGEEEDLLGGHDEKMAEPVKNKMEKPVSNKHTK
jgi:hypothetical protein